MKDSLVKQGNNKHFPIIFSLMMAGFIGMFSEMSLNVALTRLMEELTISASTVQWLTTGYMLVISILVPVSALLLQTFTTRQLFGAALGLFTAGTLLCAVSPGFSVLLIGRLIQACGTGIIIPLMFNTVLTITPVKKRGSMMGLVGLVIMFAPAVAPTLAGIIVQHLHWHWLFWVLVPFLLLTLYIGLKNIGNLSELTKPKIDALSMLLSTVGFGGFVYGFSSAGEGEGGWSNPATVYSLIVGGVALVMFVWRQLSMKQPMLDLRVFKYPMFTVGVILVMISMMVVFSFIFMMPMYLQQSLLLTVFAAGLVMLPGGIVNGVVSLITGKLFDRIGAKLLVLPGMAIAAVALWLLTGIGTGTSVAYVIALHCVMQTGLSMTIMPAQTNGLNELPKELYPHGTAVMNTLQQLAGAIGTAVCVTIMSLAQRSYLAGTSPVNDAGQLAKSMAFGVDGGFKFALVLAVAAWIIGLFIRKPAQAENLKNARESA